MRKLYFVLLFIFNVCYVNGQLSWSDFKKPQINFTNLDYSEKGKLYNKIIPNPEQIIQETSQRVCQILYKKAENIPDVKIINYKVEDYKGVSAKGGKPPVINIKFSSDHLAKCFARNPTDTLLVFNEVIGVLSHELTHAYQHDDGGRYGEIGGVIEGIADAVRTLLGYKDYNKKSPGGSYKDAYERSAFFFVWIQRNKCPDFICKLNASMAPDDGKKWTWDAVKEITGTAVIDLWNEYQLTMSKDKIEEPYFSVMGHGAKVKIGNSTEFISNSKLFDQNVYTKHCAEKQEEELIFKLVDGSDLRELRLISANNQPEGDPVIVKIEGSSDGSKWEFINSFDNIQFPLRFEEKRFPITPSQTYSYVKISLKSSSENLVQLAEIDLKIEITTGTANIYKPEFKIFPNPVKDYLTVSGLGNQLSYYQIMDRQGQVCMSGERQVNCYRLNVSSLPPGAYFTIINRKNSQCFIKR